jgi:hypothetical protein
LFYTKIGTAEDLISFCHANGSDRYRQKSHYRPRRTDFIQWL